MEGDNFTACDECLYSIEFRSSCAGGEMFALHKYMFSKTQIFFKGYCFEVSIFLDSYSEQLVHGASDIARLELQVGNMV